MNEFKAGVARQFNRGSSTYDCYADVQVAMANQLLDRLSSRPAPFKSILELGCGTGYLTAKLAEAFPAAKITAVDLAPEMVKAARRRVSAPSIEFLVADAEEEELQPSSFDLIASNATVQWFESTETTMRSLAGALRKGGLMLHATFGPRTFHELNTILDQVEGPGTRGLALASPERWAKILSAAGLEEVGCRQSTEIRHYPGLVSFFQAVKGTGASFEPNRGQARWTRYRTLKEVVARYEQRFSSPEGVKVTYELIEVWGTRNG
jgi:malonyl-CoA O-methyltransferase